MPRFSKDFSAQQKVQEIRKYVSGLGGCAAEPFVAFALQGAVENTVGLPAETYDFGKLIGFEGDGALLIETPGRSTAAIDCDRANMLQVLSSDQLFSMAHRKGYSGKFQLRMDHRWRAETKRSKIVNHFSSRPFDASSLFIAFAVRGYSFQSRQIEQKLGRIGKLNGVDNQYFSVRVPGSAIAGYDLSQVNRISALSLADIAIIAHDSGHAFDENYARRVAFTEDSCWTKRAPR